MDREKILEKFESRFSPIIPISRLDLILLCEEEKIKEDVTSIKEVVQQTEKNIDKMKKPEKK